MNYSEFLNKLDALEGHIKREKTGTAEDLAQRLNFSRRTLFNYLDLLKSKGHVIKYSRYRKTFYFDES